MMRFNQSDFNNQRDRNKVVSVEDAVAVIGDGDTICTAGFVGCGVPDELLIAIENRFLETREPRDLTLLFAAGQGDGKKRGLNRLAHEGLIRRVIGGHWGLIPSMGKLAIEGRIEAYNLPQGCISHLYRDIAAKKPGTLSKVGIGTFVDPRLEGGKIGSATHEDIVELIEIAGEEYLFYRAMPINVALIRGTTADIEGNLVMDREALTLDALAMAMAAHNSGGVVIAQVEQIAEAGSLDSRQVKVPGIFIDCVVQSRPENHLQTYATDYSPVYAGKIRAPTGNLAPMALDERKIIARRAAMELRVNDVVNLGIGMPEGVANVASEERILDLVTLTAEPGVIGGIPASGLNFGAATNASGIVDQNQQFDFYDGGGLNVACLGLAQCDQQGNINVSKFGPKLAGAGGFINISQNARKVVFAGTFSAGGLEISTGKGSLEILNEGRTCKFVREVEQISFSGSVAAANKKPIFYVTERCVFELDERGLVLTEVAPGVDLQRDILDRMDFMPVVDNPGEMDARIFHHESMDLLTQMAELSIPQRLKYDKAKKTIFINFENLHIRKSAQIREIFDRVAETCRPLNHRVDAVVNYDGFEIDKRLVDDYANMVNALVETYYSSVRRYSTKAFLRLKLKEGGPIP